MLLFGGQGDVFLCLIGFFTTGTLEYGDFVWKFLRQYLILIHVLETNNNHQEKLIGLFLKGRESLKPRINDGLRFFLKWWLDNEETTPSEHLRKITNIIQPQVHLRRLPLLLPNTSTNTVMFWHQKNYYQSYWELDPYGEVFSYYVYPWINPIRISRINSIPSLMRLRCRKKEIDRVFAMNLACGCNRLHFSVHRYFALDLPSLRMCLAADIPQILLLLDGSRLNKDQPSFRPARKTFFFFFVKNGSNRMKTAFVLHLLQFGSLLPTTIASVDQFVKPSSRSSQNTHNTFQGIIRQVDQFGPWILSL